MNVRQECKNNKIKSEVCVKKQKQKTKTFRKKKKAEKDKQIEICSSTFVKFKQMFLRKKTKYPSGRTGDTKERKKMITISI